MIREPMTLLEQSNRQRLFVGRTVRHPPIHSFLNNTNVIDVKPKARPLEDPDIQHIVATGKSMFPYVGRNNSDEFTTSSIDKDINHDENPARRKRKRPSYRKSKFHPIIATPTQAELAQLTARGIRTEVRTIISLHRTDNAVVNSQRHLAPPPSPSNDDTVQVLHEPQDRNQSRLPYQKPLKEKDKYATFRLPALNISPLSRHTPANLSSKEVRTTLSHYLRQHY